MALEKLPGNANDVLVELGNRIYSDLGGGVTTVVHNYTVVVHAAPNPRQIEEIVRRILSKADRG